MVELATSLRFVAASPPLYIHTMVKLVQRVGPQISNCTLLNYRCHQDTMVSHKQVDYDTIASVQHYDVTVTLVYVMMTLTSVNINYASVNMVKKLV